MHSHFTLLFSFFEGRGGGGGGAGGGGLVATVNERTAWILFISMFRGCCFSRPLVLFLKANLKEKKNEKKRKQTCIYIYIASVSAALECLVKCRSFIGYSEATM